MAALLCIPFFSRQSCNPISPPRMHNRRLRRMAQHVPIIKSSASRVIASLILKKPLGTAIRSFFQKAVSDWRPPCALRPKREAPLAVRHNILPCDSFCTFIHQLGIGSESKNADAICHDNSDNSSDSNPEHSKYLPRECANRDPCPHSAGIKRCRLLDLDQRRHGTGSRNCEFVGRKHGSC